MEFEEAFNKFYAIYEPLAKKHGWGMHSKFSIYEDGLIEIFEYDGEERGRHIIRATGANATECYLRAAAALEFYKI